MIIFKEILQKFQNVSCVVVVTSGSIVSKTYDLKSDIDVYVLTNANIPVKIREQIISEYSQKFEIGGEYLALVMNFLLW